MGGFIFAAFAIFILGILAYIFIGAIAIGTIQKMRQKTKDD